MKRQIVLADIGIALGMRDIEHWIELEDAAASFEDVELRTMLGVGPHQTRHPYLVIRFDRVQRLDLVDRAAEIRIALVGFVVDAELVFPAFGANAEYIEAEAFDQVVAVGQRLRKVVTNIDEREFLPRFHLRIKMKKTNRKRGRR